MKRSCLAMLVLAACAALVPPAPGQSQLGPPLPDAALSPSQLATPASLTLENGATNSLNPLSVLEGAAGVLNRGGVDATEDKSTGGKPGLSTVVNILVLLTVVSLAPSIMLMTTCFVRVLVVLGLLRQALGTQSVPPPQVITALALFMTLLVMSPTLDRINSEALAPYRAGEIRDYNELWDKAKQPVRDFMFAQIEHTGNWSSLYMVLKYRGVDISEPEKLTRADVDMVTLIPAYMLSELKAAFLMGFRIYLPFLVIDMVISTMLISMSMMMLPPVLISLPFKLLLFVLVDGWTLVVGGLIHSFAQPGAADVQAAGLALPILACGWVVRRSRCAVGAGGCNEPRR